MERNPIRTAHRLLIALALLGPAGCVTALDQARIAWADGEGDPKLAEQYYEKALQDPREAEYAREEAYEFYVEVGDKYDDEGKAARSEKWYRKALELNPSGEEALAGLARSLRDMLRVDEALAVAEKGAAQGCRNCRRLMAVMLIARADASIQAGQWAAADQDYMRAFEILPDAALALGMVRARLAQKNTDGAARALQSAVDSISRSDTEALRQFLELRRGIVRLAIEEGRPEVADGLIDLTPTGVTGDEQLDLAVEVSMELARQGKPGAALARMDTLMQNAKSGKLELSAQRTQELSLRVGALHVARAAQRIDQGELDGAQADVVAALELNPTDPTARLQRVLILAGQGQMEQAKAELDKLARGTSGWNRVGALVEAIAAWNQAEAGQLDAARASLERAKSLSPEMPGVHLAAAAVQAKTPARGLQKKDLEAVRQHGLVSYPEGEIVRAGEALSELDWARKQAKGLGATYPFRMPELSSRMDEVQQGIAAYYPYAVSFQGDPSTKLVLSSKGAGALSVDLRAPGSQTKAEIPAGESREVTIPEPGLVTLSYRGTTATFVAEPYTMVEVAL